MRMTYVSARNFSFEETPMIELKNASGQVLLRMDGSDVQNMAGQPLASTKGNLLLNLHGQVLPKTIGTKVYRGSGDALLELRIVTWNIVVVPAGV